MHEREIENLLRALLEGEAVVFWEPYVEPEYAIEQVRTFEEAGVTTVSRGLVTTAGDDREFLVSIVRSR